MTGVINVWLMFFRVEKIHYYQKVVLGIQNLETWNRGNPDVSNFFIVYSQNHIKIPLFYLKNIAS